MLAKYKKKKKHIYGVFGIGYTIRTNQKIHFLPYAGF